MEKLTDLLACLVAAEVEFVLIGGLAATTYGICYHTHDVDICIPHDFVNWKKIETAVKGLHPRWRPDRDFPFEITEERVKDVRILPIMTDLGPLDCLTSVSPIGEFEAVRKSSRLYDFSFGRCRVLDILPLITVKESIGRPQDFLVTTQLRAIYEREHKQP